MAHVWFGARTPEGAAAAAAAEGEHHVAARSSVLNLVVVAGRRETAERCAAAIEATAGRHPSRSIILASLDSEGPPSLDATIQALSIPTPGGGSVTGAETIFITVYGQVASHLASIIVPLLLHDLPVALWWPGDPNFRSHRADRLLPIADRLIVDGSAWSGDGMDRLAALAQIAGGDRRLVAADFALLRQSRWREAVASVYDLPDLRPHLRAVRSISVEYAAGDDCDRSGLTNIVRPVYHVAWLASRLGMTVDEPMKRHPDCRRTVLLRQGTHQVLAEWKPVVSDLAPGSTVRFQITSQVRGAEMVGEVTAGDLTVDVAIHDKGRERVRRTYLAPRLKDVDLLERAVEDNAGDPVAGETLAMAGCLIDAEPPARKNVARRRSHDYE
jgi:glucose-6-phosphate dehydrogenase assembly protein OpcA